MGPRRHLVLVVVGVLASMGASYPTTNFLVEAPTLQIAQQVGQYAEYYRREKAIQWLGHEMPPWPERCPLKVHLTMSGPGGATSFAFDGGRVLGQHMHIEGPLDRLLASVLPHEVTHTVFAQFYRRPVPRWADEGGAVLSEDQLEKDRHDALVRQILNTPGRKIPLRRLFALQDYPGDVMVLYAEGYSVANFLVMNGDRQRFLGFVATGMSSPSGWDQAVRAYYPPYQTVEDLEEGWLTYLRSTRRQPVQLAQNSTLPRTGAPVYPTGQPQAPAMPAPIVRAQADDSEPAGRWSIRPGYLPDYTPAGGIPSGPTPAMSASPPNRWQGPGATPYQPPNVQLGTPQALPVSATPAGELGQPVPATASPVGYPH
jgi:hypothetical protein